MSDVFFIGDLHLGHKGIMKFGQRIFETIEEHDQKLIDNWNSVVQKRDLIWVMGDVAFDEVSLDRLSECKGQKNLVLGNHDKLPIEVYMKYFRNIYGATKYKNMWMTHMPIHPNELYGRVNLHGHLHSKVFEKNLNDPRYINVCADHINMTPISMQDIQRRKDMAYNGLPK